MSPKRWQQIEAIFQTAINLPRAERLRFVVEKCRADDESRRAVEKLIAQHESADGFVESLVRADDSLLDSALKKDVCESIETNDLHDAHVDPLLDKIIGVYRLTRELGRGGMGAVYYATRADGEFRQQVAVKLIKRGMDSDFIVRRFRRERQILAALDHPNIARLVDGGTTDDNLPYFVMEYVEGEPLYNYADANRLDTNERLRLFCQICQAVSAAHEKQIVHRDIKPGNILVTRDGTPKLLDFGIAKILDSELVHESISPTTTLMRLMTPDYASPEQVCGRIVTFASDVYALGVLLYELLTGHRPYNFASRSPHEISRVICEVEPFVPSRNAASENALLPIYAARKMTVAASAEARCATVAELEKQLSGDLDAILLKALCKDQNKRYLSVQDFAGDINRHLRGESVLAELCRRQSFDERAPTGESTIGNRSLAVLPFKLLVQVSDENTDDKFLGIGLADAVIARLSRVKRFIVRPTSSVLRYNDNAAHDPLEAGKQLAVQYVLDGHIQKAGARIRVSIQLLNVAARSTVWAERFDQNFTDVLSLEDRISTQVAEALIPKLTGDDREQLEKRGTNSAAALEAYLRGRYYWSQFTEDSLAKAILSFNEAVALDPDYAQARAGIADYHIWTGIYGVLPPRECYAAAKQAAAQAVRLDAESSEARATLAHAILACDFDWTESEKQFRRAIELDSRNVAAIMLYSRQLVMEGRFDEGLKLARRAVELDPKTPFTLHHLGFCLYFARRFNESLEEYRKVTAFHEHYGIAHALHSWVLRLIGRHDEALAAVERARELFDDSLFLLFVQGQAFAAANKRREAETVLSKLRALKSKRYVSPYHTALIYTFLNDNDAALANLEAAFEAGDAWLLWTGVEPAFDNLRDDPRFVAVLEKTGNPIFFRANTIELDARSVAASTELFKRKTAAPRQIVQNQMSAEKSRPRASILAALVACCLIVTTFAGIFLSINRKLTAEAVQANSNSSVDKAIKPMSLAVVPFATVNARSDDENYLGVGTADLVTNKLSELKAINLRLASSVRRYLNTPKLPIEIGRELAVDYVVSGTIEKNGGSVVANLKMIEVASGNTIWTDDIDEPNSNLFELQDRISERIAESLSLRLTKAEQNALDKHFTENTEAYQLYLAGRYHFGKRTVEGLRQAIAMFEQASKLDPNFALAYTGAADCYGLLNWYQEPPPADAWLNAQRAAARAVELDPNLAEAHVSLAFVKFHFERDYAASEAEFKRAIVLKPNYATAHQWYSFLLSAQNRHDEAISEMSEAARLEPRLAVISTGVANVLLHARRYDEAIEQVKRSLEIDPGSIGAHVILRWNYELKGMTAEAFAEYEKERAFAGDTPTTRAKLAHVLAASGKVAEAREVLQKLDRDREIEHITPYELAVINSLLNDKDAAIEYLEKAKAQHAVGFSFARVDPHLDNLRDDARFAELLK